MATTRDIRALVASLEALDVTLPAEVAALLAADDRISAPEAYSFGPQVPLADLSPADIIGWTIRRQSNEAIRDTRVQASDMLAAASAAQLTAHADSILDQLRPAFDGAARYFTAAREVGVTERTTPAQLLDMPSKAVAAWRALAEHVGTLAAIASARIEMSRTLGLPPDTSNRIDAYAACFAPVDRGWDGNTTSVTTWLRLAAHGLSLQHPTDTAALTYSRTTPLVPESVYAMSAPDPTPTAVFLP